MDKEIGFTRMCFFFFSFFWPESENAGMFWFCGCKRPRPNPTCLRVMQRFSNLLGIFVQIDI